MLTRILIVLLALTIAGCTTFDSSLPTPFGPVTFGGTTPPGKDVGSSINVQIRASGDAALFLRDLLTGQDIDDIRRRWWMEQKRLADQAAKQKEADREEVATEEGN